MSKRFGDDTLIDSCMRNRNTGEFMGTWEPIHDLVFKGGEFETFKKMIDWRGFLRSGQRWMGGAAMGNKA